MSFARNITVYAYFNTIPKGAHYIFPIQSIKLHIQRNWTTVNCIQHDGLTIEFLLRFTV